MGWARLCPQGFEARVLVGARPAGPVGVLRRSLLPTMELVGERGLGLDGVELLAELACPLAAKVEAWHAQPQIWKGLVGGPRPGSAGHGRGRHGVTGWLTVTVRPRPGKRRLSLIDEGGEGVEAVLERWARQSAANSGPELGPGPERWARQGLGDSVGRVIYEAVVQDGAPGHRSLNPDSRRHGMGESIPCPRSSRLGRRCGYVLPAIRAYGACMAAHPRYRRLRVLVRVGVAHWPPRGAHEKLRAALINLEGGRKTSLPT